MRSSALAWGWHCSAGCRAGGLRPRRSLSLGLFIALADFIIVGLRRKTPLFQRFTALVLGSSLSERLTGLASFALLVGLLLFFKLFWIWMALALAAVGIVSGLRAGAAQRRGTARPLELAESIVRSLRRHGHDEDLVRQFVCTSCGPDWEELYEALFGYESMLRAPRSLGTSRRPETPAHVCALARICSSGGSMPG